MCTCPPNAKAGMVTLSVLEIGLRFCGPKQSASSCAMPLSVVQMLAVSRWHTHPRLPPSELGSHGPHGPQAVAVLGKHQPPGQLVLLTHG